MMKIQAVEQTATWCAEQARDLVLGERMPWPAGQEILAQRFTRAIEHGVMVHAETMTREEVEAFAGASCPPGYAPVYCLAVGLTPEGVPAFAVCGFLADRTPTQAEAKSAETAALNAFGYGPEIPRFTITQGNHLQ